jgi:hypothetical protein
MSACGGDDDDDDAAPGGSDTTEQTSDGESAPLTDSFRGVTAEEIKLGFVMVNYECIADFVDFKRGDDQAAYQAFVDDINANGGILGRQIVPVYKSYCPIGNTESLQICTALTDDEAVFAVLGVFIDFTGDAQLCLAREHDTIHIGHELTQGWIDDAPPGLLLTPDITNERRLDVLLQLLETEGTLEGRKVAVMADDENGDRAENTIVPALEEAGVELGTTAILTVTGSSESGVDTSGGQAQLDAFLEKWKEEDVDTIMIAGLSLVTRQWVEKIGNEIPGVQFLVDAPASAIQAARDAKAAGTNPNPYENMFTAESETDAEIWDTPPVQRCVKIYEDASGTTVVPPDEVQPGPDGKREETYASVLVNCGELEMFQAIAEKAGADLTNETWTAAVNDFGPIELATSSFATLHEGKYDANDAFRLVRFDGTVGDAGDWAPVTDIVNTAEE